MSRRIFDEPFKRMALDLAHARGSILSFRSELFLQLLILRSHPGKQNDGRMFHKMV
ncbi:hypothetical protein BCL90_0249 [Pedobacter alluvionis]|uniref:Uncharacterized protein n=1 Tax=Pedobacter alluvionis TaxID=475253 RepID=A0A497YAQ5_9SPHI|nr:hypothetical protein BCL90_0249 [Pedobacter alluvionis]